MINYNISKKEFEDHISMFYDTIENASEEGNIIDIILENKQKITIEFSYKNNVLYLYNYALLLYISVPADTKDNRELDTFNDWIKIELDTSKIIAIINRGFADKKYGTIQIE